jgi:hypothetical protein
MRAADTYKLIDDRSEGCARHAAAPGLAFREYPVCDDQPGHCRSSIACTTPESCVTKPHGECVAQVDSRCVYPDGERACQSTADCAQLPGGVCVPVQRCDDRGRCEAPQRHCAAPALDSYCAKDSDCRLLAGGHCDRMITRTYCSYAECLTDSECGTGERCACTGYFLKCMPSDCSVDLDCAAGQHCQASTRCEDFVDAIVCTTPRDGCRRDSDCTSRETPTCAYDPNETRWRCMAQCIVDSIE